MVEIERVQTGVRMEKRLLKVLKGLAELKDLSLGDLLEGIVLHAFEGRPAFAKETLAQIVVEDPETIALLAALPAESVVSVASSEGSSSLPPR